MAKVVSRVLSFVPSLGASGYRIRVAPANSTPVYSEEFADVTNPQASGGRVRINLLDLPLFKGIEGVRDVHVTALDSAGNESDFLEVDNVEFDFDPPAAPTDGRIEAQ